MQPNSYKYIEAVDTAMEEAERFLDRAAKVKARAMSEGKKTFFALAYTADNAAMKRASLDLTRALAVMRQTTM